MGLDVVDQAAGKQRRVGVENGFLGTVDDDTRSWVLDLDVRVDGVARSGGVLAERNEYFVGFLVITLVNPDAAEEVSVGTSDADDEESSGRADGGVDAVLNGAEDGDELVTADVSIKI